MSIPASKIVNVIPRVITGGSNDLEFNGLLFTENDTISSEHLVLEFTSPATVAAYFGLTSIEYGASQIYFTGYQNKLAAPRRLFISRRIAEPARGWLRGGRYTGTIAAIQAISAGAISINVNGTQYNVTNLDFTDAHSYSEVAGVIQSALSGDSTDVEVTYSSLFGAFTISSTTVGATSIVEYATTASGTPDVGALLNFTQANGALRSRGSDGLTVPEQIAAVQATTENWFSFSTLWEATEEELLDFATWASANYGWLYVPWTTDPNTIVPTASTDAASLLMDGNYDHVAIVYGTYEYAVFMMGSIASIAWNRENSTITLAFKRQSNLAAYVTEEADADTLKAKNCNYFGRFATRNAEFVFLYEGLLSASDYRFIDSYVNHVWINNRLQVSIMDGLVATGRVPYNTAGYTLIRSWMVGPSEDGRLNGVIDIGVSLSESQKSELFNEAGQDITEELQTTGYFIQIIDPGVAVRAQRDTPICNYWFVYAGSVHRIEVGSVAIL